MRPYITVITSTLNCETEIVATAKSIREKSYTELQWIIADGGSTDLTLSMLSDYSDIKMDILSEPDKGIYDAWNKACRLIKGEWVIFLGAGDLLAPDLDIHQLVSILNSLESDYLIAYGDVAITSNNIIRYIARVTNLNGWEFSRPRLPHHQGVFQHKSLFENKTPFDDSYRIAADSKFLLLSLKEGKAFHIDTLITYMSDCGVSNNYKNSFDVQSEINRLCKELDIHQGIIRLSFTYLYRCSNFLLNFILPLGIRCILQKSLDKIRGKHNTM